jgi:hypothetical protein
VIKVNEVADIRQAAVTVCFPHTFDRDWRNNATGGATHFEVTAEIVIGSIPSAFYRVVDIDAT